MQFTMTKNEIIYGGQKSDEQIFEMDVADLLLEFRKLSVALSTRLYRTGVFSGSQIRRLRELVEQLEKLQVSMRSWQFHGKKDQLIFAEWEKEFEK